MLNHMAVMRAPVPQNQFITLDPLAMRKRDYSRPSLSVVEGTNGSSDDDQIDRDPWLLASPFCNPDL